MTGRRVVVAKNVRQYDVYYVDLTDEQACVLEELQDSDEGEEALRILNRIVPNLDEKFVTQDRGDCDELELNVMIDEAVSV